MSTDNMSTDSPALWNSANNIPQAVELTDYKGIYSSCEANSHVFHILTLAVICPLIIVVNVVVLMTVTLVPQLNNPQDVLVAMVAMADLMVGVVFLPLHYMSDFFTEVFNRETDLCVMTYFSSVFLQFSLTAYVLMCINCSLAINFPFLYQARVSNAKVIISVTVVAFLECVHTYILLHVLMKYHGEVDHGKVCDLENNFPVWYYTKYEPVLVSIKLLLGLGLNIQIHLVAKRQRVRIRRVTMSSIGSAYSSSVTASDRFRHFRVLTVPIICSVLFIILWAPSLFPLILSQYDVISKYNMCLMQEVTAFIKYSNSFLSKLLFCCYKPIYRHGFKVICTTPPWGCLNLKDRLRLGVHSLMFSTQSRQVTTTTTISTFTSPKSTDRRISVHIPSSHHHHHRPSIYIESPSCEDIDIEVVSGTSLAKENSLGSRLLSKTFVKESFMKLRGHVLFFITPSQEHLEGSEQKLNKSNGSKNDIRDRSNTNLHSRGKETTRLNPFTHNGR